jgi:LCP family protein required for cell wall assembly
MFDSTKRSKHSQASRGASLGRRTPQEITSLEPSSASDKSVRQAERVRERSGKVLSPAARSRKRRRIAMIVGIVVVVLLLVGGVAAYAYVQSVGNKINSVTNADPTLAALLKANQATTTAGQPFYVVLMGSDTRKGQAQQRSDSLIVARIDPQKKKVQMISLPRDSRVAIPGYGTTKINAAATYGGPKLVIKTVEQLTGLTISHYVNINFTGFRDVVDAIGGVWVNVPINIYDTQASAFGKKYATLKKGYQKLDGAHALTFARTRHYFASGDYQRMKDQQILIKAIATQALSLSNVFKASSIVDAVASNLDTDMTPAEIASLVLEFKGMKAGNIQSITAPSAPKYINGVSYVIINKTSLARVISRMKQGLSLTSGSSSTSTASTVKAADVTLTVRNGAGVSGLGKQCTTFLTSKGFTISDTGNAAQFVYGRTLVVYKTGHEADANLVRSTLGFGDVIPSAGMYTFKTNVMVIIGKDWKNPATS